MVTVTEMDQTGLYKYFKIESNNKKSCFLLFICSFFALKNVFLNNRNILNVNN